MAEDPEERGPGSLQTLPWRTLATGTGGATLQRLCLQTGQGAGLHGWLGQWERNREGKVTEHEREAGRSVV